MKSLEDRLFPEGEAADEESLCPFCAEPLATLQARQCFDCGMDWHDPNNVVNRREGGETSHVVKRFGPLRPSL